MARLLSLYRRRPNLVDVNLQSGPYAPMAIGLGSGKAALSYDFYVGQNFDSASFTKFQTVPASGGYASPTTSLPGSNIAFDGEQFSQSRTPYLTRFKFAPSDYASVFTAAGVSDTTPIWLRVVQNNVDGTTNSVGHPTVYGTVDLDDLTYGAGGSVDGLTLHLKYNATAYTIGFVSPVNRGDLINQINLVTAPNITASIDNQSQLVLTGIGTGGSNSITVVGDAGTLTALGLTAASPPNPYTGAVNILQAPHLILPYISQPNRPIMLSGTAPEASSLASSLEIQLPMQVNNVQIQNNGSNPLFVAFEPTGPEFEVYPVSSAPNLNLYETYPASSQLFVRATGGTTTFNLISALRNNPV